MYIYVAIHALASMPSVRVGTCNYFTHGITGYAELTPGSL